MVAFIILGISMPLITAVLTAWLVWRYLPPAVVKAMHESLNRNEGTTQ